MLPFLPVPGDSASGIIVFLGRFHPLVLHFPIVLVLLTLGVEGWSIYQQRKPQGTGAAMAARFNKDVAFLTGPLLAISLLSALVTVIGGYLLYRSGEYQGEMVRKHLWGGVLLILALSGAVFYYGRKAGEAGRNKAVYRALLLSAGILIIYTSHLGGSITHGPDFLTEHIPRLRPLEPAPVEAKKPQDLLVFQDLIMPVLDDRCLSCHNEYKTKGGLVMASYAGLEKGGKSEKPLLVAGHPEKSELFHRVTLPAEDEDRMPPPEKAPLEEDEIALIRWWLREGAAEEMVLGVEPPDSIVALMERYLPKLYRSERLKMRQREELEALAAELSEVGEKLGLVIEPDPENPGFFGVSMQMPPAFVDNRAVAGLRPYASLFSKLSLPGAEITDDALYDISKMRNLKDLFLPKTCIKGEGLVYLKSLPQLETINLSNSFLTNDGILNLIQLPEIKTVYTFGVEADTVVLRALQKHLPEMEIREEEGPYY
jgi:uncharacterized membrane protein